MINKYIQNYLSQNQAKRYSYEAYAEAEDIARAMSTAIQDTIQAAEDAYINNLNTTMFSITGLKLSVNQENSARAMFRNSIKI